MALFSEYFSFARHSVSAARNATRGPYVDAGHYENVPADYDRECLSRFSTRSHVVVIRDYVLQLRTKSEVCLASLHLQHE